MNAHSLARTTPYSRGLLVERIESGWKVARAAGAAGVSERTAYKWLARYRADGPAGLLDRSARPRRVPSQLDDRIVEMILELRRQRRTGPQIATALGLVRSTVARVLRRAGLHRLRLLDPPTPARRYERHRPGELLHIDVKKLGRIGQIGHRIHGNRKTRVRGIGWEYVHVCVDDASRLAYVEVLPDERKHTAVGFLERAVAWYRSIGIRSQRVMTDNGCAYVSREHATACARLGLRHIRTRPYRPQTNGKAERMIQTLLREWAYARPYHRSQDRIRALRPWLRHYNCRRPHGALGGRPPISRLEVGG